MLKSVTFGACTRCAVFHPPPRVLVAPVAAISGQRSLREGCSSPPVSAGAVRNVRADWHSRMGTTVRLASRPADLPPVAGYGDAGGRGVAIRFKINEDGARVAVVDTVRD